MKEHFDVRPKGVCSTKISFDVEDGVVSHIIFTGGCNGNLKMISKLLEGKTADFIIDNCSGNTCGFKNTSCADQLAKCVAEVVGR